MDQSFKDLIEASSLGTPAARRIRSSTPSEVVDDVRHRMELRRKLSLRYAVADKRVRRIHWRRVVRALAIEQLLIGGTRPARTTSYAQNVIRGLGEAAGDRGLGKTQRILSGWSAKPMACGHSSRAAHPRPVPRRRPRRPP